MDQTIQLFIKNLPYLLKAAGIIPEIMEYLQKTKESLAQSAEWDQATEDAFNKELQDLKDNPPDWWKPEPKQP
jgi:hypothetical protein